MGNEFIERKINEINSKNSSEEEKIREINKLKKGYVKTYSMNEGTYNFIALLIIAAVFPFLAAPLSMIEFLFPEYMFEFAFIGFICSIPIFYFFYLIFRKIILIFTNSCKKKIIKTEARNYQEMYENVYEKLKNNYDFKKKRNSIVFKTFVTIIHIVLLIIGLPFIASLGFPDAVELIIAGYFLIMSLAFPLTIIGKRGECNSIYKDEVVFNFIKNFNNIKYVNEENKRHTIDSKFNCVGLTSTSNLDVGNKVEENIKPNSLAFDYIYSGFDSFRETVRYIDTDNYMNGYIKNSFVEMAHIHSMQTGGRRNTNYFSGFFVSINSNKLFPESQIRSRWLRHVKKENLVEIGSNKFNKYFKVLAENKENIQEYITPDLIDFIAEFREKYKINFEIAFKDKIYVRFYTKYIFYPTIFSRKAQKYSAYEYYVITKFTEELVEKLNNM